MVRTKTLKKENLKNRYKKTTKTNLPKEIKTETKKGKIVNSRVIKSNIDRKSIDSFDEKNSEFKSTCTKDKIAIISPIKTPECSNTIKNDCVRKIYFDHEAKDNHEYDIVKI